MRNALPHASRVAFLRSAPLFLGFLLWRVVCSDTYKLGSVRHGLSCAQHRGVSSTFCFSTCVFAGS